MVVAVAEAPCLQTLEGHRSLVTSVEFSPNGQQLASASYDHTLRLWDVTTGNCLHNLEGHRSLVTLVAFLSQWAAAGLGL